MGGSPSEVGLCREETGLAVVEQRVGGRHLWVKGRKQWRQKRQKMQEREDVPQRLEKAGLKPKVAHRKISLHSGW